MATEPYVVWKVAFSVANEELDSQHKGMFKLLNELHAALEEGQSQKRVDELIVEACQYGGQHFRTEESLMARCGYPHLKEHQRMHEEYVARVEQIRRNADHSLEEMAYELFFYLREWWLNHITQADAEYAPWLKKTGLSSR